MATVGRSGLPAGGLWTETQRQVVISIPEGDSHRLSLADSIKREHINIISFLQDVPIVLESSCPVMFGVTCIAQICKENR